MRVLINPRIVQASEEMVDGREGCWSCDDFCANVPRAAWIEIEAYDEHGEMFHERLEGFTARIAQHEIDHLDGVRCIDRVPEDEPERLHLVHKDNPAEFERYRKEWATWDKHFPREEWERFREGRKVVRCYDLKEWEALSADQLPRLRKFELMVRGGVAGKVKLADRPICEAELQIRYPDTPMIYQLYVDDAFRRQGVGNELMDEAERVAREEGHDAILLCVKPDNQAARQMYEQRGYEYLTFNGKQTVESVWHLRGENGDYIERVDLMPMRKTL